MTKEYLDSAIKCLNETKEIMMQHGYLPLPLDLIKQSVIQLWEECETLKQEKCKMTENYYDHGDPEARLHNGG